MSALPETSLERELRLRARDVRVDEPLWRHVTLRVGGPADLLVIPRRREELEGTIAFLLREGRAFVALGQGSNVLIGDRGIRGVVVKISKGIDRIRWEGPRVTAETGYGLPHLAQEAARRGLGGLEFAAGIPASVGGAVVMNAGAHGHAMQEITEQVEVLTASGAAVIAAPALGFRYRTSALQGITGAALAATLRLVPGDPAEIRERMETWLRQRNATQPIGPPSSGCVFRNPDGDHAGRLIDLAGAKGMAVGGAIVSEIHANYIVNRGEATAANVRGLIDQVRERVRRASGHALDLEIKLLGEF